MRHLGPVAEDFWDAFGLGMGRTTIGLSDIDGVNFVAAQALDARTLRLREELTTATAAIAARDARIDELEARLARLEPVVARLEAMVAAPP